MREDHAPISVVCDFDGTITLLDTSEYILERFAEGDWRAPDRLLLQRSIDLEECMVRQFSLVHRSPEEMLDSLNGRVVIRKGFQELVEICSQNGIPFHVASAGLDFVIRHYLDSVGTSEKVVVHAPSSDWSGGSLRLHFPPLKHPGARSFKDDVVLTLKGIGRSVVYIGDGISDLDGARSADVRFAVRGRPLLDHLIKDGIAATPFVEFEEIAESIGLSSVQIRK